MFACTVGNSQVVEFLLNNSANWNIKSVNEVTPLYLASYNGHLSVVEQLLKAKVDIDCLDDTGATPLFVASQQSHLAVAKKLHEAKANPNLLRQTWPNSFKHCWLQWPHNYSQKLKF